jgi:tetratricopeptide (TPR) repeat protein
MLLLAALFFPASSGVADERDQEASSLIEWTLQPGESLPQLAALIYPHDRAMQRYFVAAALRLNFAVYENRNFAWHADQPTAILLPDLKQLSSLARAPQARRKMPLRADGAHLPRLRMAGAVEPHVAAALPPQASDGRAALKLARSMPSLGIEAQISQLEALQALNQELRSAQAALDDRVAALENGIARIAELLAQEPDPAPPLPQKPRRAKPAAMEKPAAWSPVPLMYPLAALLPTVGGWLLWRRHQRRQSLQTQAVLVPVPAVAPGSASESKSASARHAAAEGAMAADEITSLVEEARIFVALGRSEQAIEVLQQHIAAYPQASVHPWLYLMDVLRAEGRKDEFAECARRFHLAFNAIAPQWEAAAPAMMVVARSIEEFPHILARLTETWGTPDCQAFLTHLLQDNRGGERIGFSKDVLDEILLLQGILDLRPAMPGI